MATVMMAASAQAGPCPTTNLIEDPADFAWQDEGGYFSGTLEIGEANFTIGGESITTRAYGQGGAYSIPGPTLRMAPGQTYVVTFQNNLPYETPVLEHNVFKDPNISNIHTHGLHISGESPADDVTRNFEGGYCGDYVYDIPDDHMGGTYWYHAHHHGSTYLQVSGGAFGLILVDDANDGLPTPVAGMTERQLVVAFLDPDVAGTGGDSLISGTLSPTWTVNGAVEGNLCTPADEWQHWRVLLADRDAKRKTLSVGESCEVALLARDGVWRSTAPKPLPDNAIELTGASRADLAVRCSADSTIEVDGTVVANVYADDSLPSDSSVGPYDFASNPIDGTWEASRPHYLRDLRGEIGPVQTQTISMGARTINGGKFELDVPTFAIDQPGLQEWTIKGATNHPFHLHIYHVQMQGACGDFEDGEYYDTVAANGCEVRFDASPEVEDTDTGITYPATAYAGRTIMHCHILAHEDQGAMGWVDVAFAGALPPPAFPSSDFSEYYQCAGGPPVCEPTEPSETACSDGLDNDCDGLIDGEDPDCAGPPPPSACGDYGDRNSCRADRACRWDNKNDLCIAK
jgi:FtsP/CotA-like multicopper oxidase with cupredoxin domain